MSTQETSKKTSSTFADTTKGAVHVAHGVTENIFGSVMGAFDSEGAKAQDKETVSKGRAEVERGMAQMKGKPVPGTTAGGTESQGEGKDAQPQQLSAKQEGTIPASPEAASQREPTVQDPGKAQKGTQETQEAVPTKPPKGEDLVGEGADAPQGPGSHA